LVDFSALAGAGAAAAIVEAATAAPVVARNSRLLIIKASLTARLITHFAQFSKRPLLAQSIVPNKVA
jgi:hypothetical protein